MKKILVNILTQIIPVMLGVYLGFAMNNFGESQKLKTQSATYKKMLRNEIAGNLKALENVNPYHVEITNDFTNLLKAKNIKEQFNQMEFHGFRPGFVNNSAYDTGIQTGIIQEFKLDLIQSLNEMYTLQGKYNRFNENMVNSFLAAKFPETESEIKNTLMSSTMSMNDVLIFEKELMQYYKELLDLL